MPDASLTTPLDPGPVDLRHLDGVLANLRRGAADATALVAFVTEARDRLAAAPDNLEARYAVRRAEQRMRADAYALAHNFAALVLPNGAAP